MPIILAFPRSTSFSMAAQVLSKARDRVTSTTGYDKKSDINISF